MAKKDNENILLVVLVLLSFVIFSAAFVAGYLYGDELTSIIGPRFRQEEERVGEVSQDSPPKTDDSSLPNNFPSDFPVYDNAALVDSWTASGNQTEGISVIWETDDSVSAVKGFFERELAESAWTISSRFEEDDSSTLTFEKGGTSGFIGITRGDDVTVISVTMGVGE